jgi:N utilization substance protein B
MGRRRKARESALQILYELEFGPVEPEEAIGAFWRKKSVPEATREYGGWLVRGVLDHREELDEAIQKISRHWRIARMGLVDRNILRLAAYELIYARPTAPAIVINEAIELAKKFSGPEAATFVNGILDGLRKSIQAAGETTDRKEEHVRPKSEKRKVKPRRRSEEN